MNDKAPEWLDVIVYGKMMQINSKGDLRESVTPKDTSKGNVRKPAPRFGKGRQTPVQPKDAADKQNSVKKGGGQRKLGS